MSEERGTQTSRFGSRGRSSHDLSYFYASRMYADHQLENHVHPQDENALPEEVFDQILIASSEDMHHLPDASVHLMVTSPPYNARKEYDEDLTLEEYLKFLENVFRETYRVLVPGGRACVKFGQPGTKALYPAKRFHLTDDGRNWIFDARRNYLG